MPRAFIYFLFLPILGWAQESPITKSIKIARRVGKVETFSNLFTLKETTPGLKNARSSAYQIQHLTIVPGILSRIKSSKHNLLELSIPTNDGKLELELLPVDIFAPGFTVKTSQPDPNFKFDNTKLRFYQGSLKNNAKSIAAFAFYDRNIIGMISDSTGNHVLARKDNQSTAPSEYAFYNEEAVKTESRQFNCGTVEGPIKSQSKPIQTSGARESTASSCAKYVSIYAEADYTLYQAHNSDSNVLTPIILYWFNQVSTIYKNENIILKIGQLKIWNSPDPYHNDDITSTLNAFQIYWSNLGDSYPGNIAHLMTNRSLGGGLANANLYGDFSHKDLLYSVSSGLGNVTVNYPNYSWEVEVITHELGHNFGSNHTQWCGWQGGALDNCYFTENDNGPCKDTSGKTIDCSECSRGPAPGGNGKGTIMSYCHLSVGIDFTKGFGPQPGDLIRRTVNVSTLPATIPNDNAESIASGSWSQATTWNCGVVPITIYDATISNGNTVQINFTEAAKSLNVNGVLNLSSLSSTLNINNN